MKDVISRMIKGSGIILVIAALLAAYTAVFAATPYPSKPIRLILPLTAGGSTDILGRIISQKLAEGLGQPVVTENRGGAGINVGSEFVAKSRPDGYTILLVPSALAMSPSMYKKLNYDPIKDLAPISLVAEVPPYLLIVRSSLPVNSLKELVEYAKANPGKLNYGTTGVGAVPHLAGELFKSSTKTNIVHVPYKGGAQAMTGLLSGETDMQMATASLAMPFIQASKVKVLAILRDSNERLQLLPNVPTTKEGGLDNCEVKNWFGMLAPAGTPRDIVNRLNAEWVKIAEMPEARELLRKVQFEPLSSTPEKFSEFLKSEIALWAKVIKEANIQLEE